MDKQPVTPQSPVPTVNNVAPQSAAQPPAISSSEVDEAVKSVNSAGKWVIGFGIFNLVFIPLIGALLYSPSRKTAIITNAVAGFIVGIVMIGFGVKLRKTSSGTLDAANKLLIYLAVIAAVLMVTSFIAGGSPGLINLVLVFIISQPRQKIVKLKKSQQL